MCQIDGLRQVSRALLKVRRIDQVRRFWRVPQALLEAGGVAAPSLPLALAGRDCHAARVQVGKINRFRTEAARAEGTATGLVMVSSARHVPGVGARPQPIAARVP
jgi:hypothetical protein